MKVCCDFGVLAFFAVYNFIWLFVAFLELLGLEVGTKVLVC
jgi:hypothetical protein